MRRLQRITAVAVVIAAIGANLTPAYGLVAAPLTPAQRAIGANVVVVGKVTAIEKDVVEVLPFPNAPNKIPFKVAVVKIETGLIGADNITHVKIGFVATAQSNPNAPQPGGGVPRPRGPLAAVELKEGQEMMFFLTKHPTGEFFVTPGMSPPVDVKTEQGKKDLEAVKKIAAVLADPMKGLKSDKADVRAESAVIMAMKYRAYPNGAAEVDQVAIDADESKLILKGLTEAKWNNNVRPVPGAQAVAPNALQAFYAIGLNEKDGWKQPAFPRPQQGQPPIDYGAIQKKAFTEWLEGPGKDYTIKKMVAKKKSDK